MWVIIEQVIKDRQFLIACNYKWLGALRICSSVTKTAFFADLWVRTKKKRPMALQRCALHEAGRWLWAGCSPPWLSPRCWGSFLPPSLVIGTEQVESEPGDSCRRRLWRQSINGGYLVLELKGSFWLSVTWGGSYGLSFADFILLCLQLYLSNAF